MAKQHTQDEQPTVNLETEQEQPNKPPKGSQRNPANQANQEGREKRAESGAGQYQED